VRLRAPLLEGDAAAGDGDDGGVPVVVVGNEGGAVVVGAMDTMEDDTDGWVAVLGMALIGRVGVLVRSNVAGSAQSHEKTGLS
jgi:hypothetical protein